MDAGKPGRLTGSGIRELPEGPRENMLRRLKLDTGKNKRVDRVRYRITGFFDAQGSWIVRNPRNGQYYRYRPKGSPELPGRHRTPVRPTAQLLKRSSRLAIEVEVDRGRGPRVYYTTLSQS